MIEYARLTPGRGFAPRQALFYYVQRLFSRPAPRRTVSRVLATAVNLTQGPKASPELTPMSLEALAALRADGLARLHPLAGETHLEEMYDYFMARPVVGPDGRDVALSELPAGTAAAAYNLQTVVDCPGLLEIVNSPQVLEIASAYIGCKPTLSSLGVRWSLPAATGAAHFQNFHRDIDDWRFLKLFVYLTDVDEDCGPHCYVRTSHHRSFLWRAREYSPDTVADEFGLEKLETITGPRGTTFLADTLGVHRGGRVENKPRLILQAQYSILPVFAFRYAPVPAAAMAIDHYINRLLITPDPSHFI